MTKTKARFIGLLHSFKYVSDRTSGKVEYWKHDFKVPVYIYYDKAANSIILTSDKNLKFVNGRGFLE